ncbi:GNAT family N-acetyltransferase [Pseudenhygromyxa sp. WMMC2535]|uniref:GNAT family N-acetyltransferase n=1 Tax=Pseudenhygromyxa sp. WMMC2535 TaxID=2712867 RepID=UPI001554C84F|nr:GNAT family N-acetyltransferase [Pseudenhygromyxa sp. WMMC2535]NVB38936.1 GNAT family N-acetyltransferase [Pseudenhygromyxa sp. WMMC2535]
MLDLVDLTLRELPSLEGVDCASWNALDHRPSPFLEWGFLRALERSGSTSVASGWDPHYLLVYSELPNARSSSPDQGGSEGEGSSPAGGQLLGAVPAYIKTHSYGEYIFDWQWARAAMANGLPYYPKLVVAAPATPATGKRILLHPQLDEHPALREAVARRLIAGVRELADERRCSSIHWLFCTDEERRLLEDEGFAARRSYQFHWRNQGYADFDAFLATLTSRKRKQIRKERRRAVAAVDGCGFVPGTELGPGDLAALDRFYRRTVNLYGGREYLRPGFFQAVAELCPERLQFFAARRDGEPLAGAIFFESEHGLYGRYWGCDEEIEFMHFEAAYYAGIERCIERGLPLFEAGAQGEHKLLRGFMPSLCHSAHWMRHPALDRGVREFLREEAAAIEDHVRMLAEYGPYKQDEGGLRLHEAGDEGDASVWTPPETPE